MKKLISVLLICIMAAAFCGCSGEKIELPKTYIAENAAQYSETASFPDISRFITELTAETMEEIPLDDDNTYFDEENGIKYQSNAFNDEWTLTYEVDGAEVVSSFYNFDAVGNCLLDEVEYADGERLIYLGRHKKDAYVMQKDVSFTDAETGAEITATCTYTQDGMLIHIITKTVEENGNETVAEYDGANKFLGASVKRVSGGNKCIGGYNHEGKLSYYMNMDRKGKATYHDGSGKQIDYDEYRRLIGDASLGGWLEMVTGD